MLLVMYIPLLFKIFIIEPASKDVRIQDSLSLIQLLCAF